MCDITLKCDFFPNMAGFLRIIGVFLSLFSTISLKMKTQCCVSSRLLLPSQKMCLRVTLVMFL